MTVVVRCFILKCFFCVYLCPLSYDVNCLHINEGNDSTWKIAGYNPTRPPTLSGWEDGHSIACDAGLLSAGIDAIIDVTTSACDHSRRISRGSSCRDTSFMCIPPYLCHLCKIMLNDRVQNFVCLYLARGQLWQSYLFAEHAPRGGRDGLLQSYLFL